MGKLRLLLVVALAAMMFAVAGPAGAQSVSETRGDVGSLVDDGLDEDPVSFDDDVDDGE